MSATLTGAGKIEHMFVLGIDPGLTRTGYGVLRVGRGRPQVVAGGVLRTDPDRTMPERLAELHGDLVSLIHDHAPAVMALERVFIKKNLTNAMSVARASGVAMLAAAQAGLPVREYTPTAVKLAVAGDGSAGKEQVADLVVRRLGLSEAPEPADVADALAVALCHAQQSHIQAALDAVPATAVPGPVESTP